MSAYSFIAAIEAAVKAIASAAPSNARYGIHRSAL